MIAGSLLFIYQMMRFFSGEKHPEFREGSGAVHAHDSDTPHSHNANTDKPSTNSEVDPEQGAQGDGAKHSHDGGTPHSHGDS